LVLLNSRLESNKEEEKGGAESETFVTSITTAMHAGREVFITTNTAAVNAAREPDFSQHGHHACTTEAV